MTVVAVWLDKDFAYMAADTRLSREKTITTDNGAKIFTIPIVCLRADNEGMLRAPHAQTRYGFAFAGAVLPAVMTAITATSMLGCLVSTSGSQMPPKFDSVAAFIEKLALRFMREHFEAAPVKASLFSAALLGWCAYEQCHKLGHITWSMNEGDFKAGLEIKPQPQEKELWAQLGTGATDVRDCAKIHRDKGVPWQIAPKKAIEEIIERDQHDIGGAVSMGFCNHEGFQQFTYLHKPVEGGTEVRAFNGIDLDVLGNIDHYCVGGFGFN